jgi:hypothetical protein
MTHLAQDRLYATTLDDARLSSDEQSHLETCQQCQGELNAIRAIVKELQIAHAIEPSSAALDLYQSIFLEHGPAAKSALERAWTWITATLVLDSRTQPLPAATRSVRAESYRILYDSPSADIELFVEGEGSYRHLQGDVMELNSEPSVSIAKRAEISHLIQLQDTSTLKIVLETYTNEEGRFWFEAVPVGNYRLLVTDSQDILLEIADLVIT